MADEYDEDPGDDGAGEEAAPASSVNPHPGHCRVCDVAVLPRTRQYCDEHKHLAGKGAKKKNRRIRSVPAGGETASASARDRLLDECGAILDDIQGNTIALLAPVAPITAGTWVTRAESNTRAVLTIARAHPKVLEGILKAAETEAYIALGAFALAIVAAVGVEVGMVEGDGAMARGLGITDIWEEVEASRAYYGGEVAAHYTAAQPPDESQSVVAAAAGGLVAEL